MPDITEGRPGTSGTGFAGADGGARAGGRPGLGFAAAVVLALSSVA